MRSSRLWCAPLVAAGMIAIGAAETAMAQVEPEPDKILRVKADQGATWGSQTGDSWTAAYQHLRDAIDVAKAWTDGIGHEDDIVHIWVKEGVYAPDRSDNPLYVYVEEGQPVDEVDGVRSLSFMLHQRVQMYGGFAGTESSSEFGLRDPYNNVTTLTGDLWDPGDPTADEDVDDLFEQGFYGTFEDNAYQVCRDTCQTNGSVLDGFTIRGGFADTDTGQTRFGGGLMIAANCAGGGPPHVPPTVRQCNFSHNYARQMGGAIYTTIGNPFEIWDCKFIQNRSGFATGDNKAGAILSDAAVTRIVRCTFEGNFTTGDGGAVSHLAGSPTFKIISSDFRNNVASGTGDSGAPGWGGAIFLKTTSGGEAENGGTEITNCLFADNHAADEGGAIYVDTVEPGSAGDDPLPISNSTFTGNTSGGVSGGVYIQLAFSSDEILVRNSILHGNDGPLGSGLEPQIAVDGGTLTIQYSDVQGWCGSITCGDIVGSCTDCYDPANGNLDVDPGFRGATNFYLQYGSTCVDAGSNTLLSQTPDTADLDGSAATASLPVDINGSIRLQDGDGDTTATVDMGAYELAPPSTCDADLNGNCTVNGIDLALLLGEWGPCSCPEDLNGDGVVDGFDLAILLGMWGPCEDCESLLLFGGGEEESEQDEDYPLLLWWLLTGNYAAIFEWADALN